MTTPFDSSGFFTNPFFGAKAATVARDNKTVQAIDFSKLSPANQGKLLGRPGDWTQWYFKVSDISQPQPSDTFTVGSVTWRVDSTDPQGDVYEVLAVSNQRAHQ